MTGNRPGAFKAKAAARKVAYLQRRTTVYSFALSRTLDIKRCVFIVFLPSFSFFIELFLAVEQLATMPNHLNVKRVQKKNLSSCRSTKVMISFIVFVDPGAIG